MEIVYNDGIPFLIQEMPSMRFAITLSLLLTAVIAHANEEFYYFVKLDYFVKGL